MSTLLSLVPAVIVLGVLIIVHEFGHFLACRLTGVKVDKFSIGFGPELLHWQGRETRYTISLILFGGYVKPAGESMSDLGEEGVAKPGDYLAASLPSRFFIIISGVLMNYFLAFSIFVLLFVTGIPVTGTGIGGFVEGYPAETSGLEVGDVILQVNRKDVRTWTKLTASFQEAPEEEIELVVQRGKKTLVLNVIPRVEEMTDVFGEIHEVRILGIHPNMEATRFERYGFFKAIRFAWDKEVFLAVMTHKAIFYLILGKLSLKALAGPVGIIKMTGETARLGMPYVLHLTGVLSISLAVINLFPIPALDGGHLVFLLIEAVRRRRVSLELQERVTQVGFFLLLVLFAFILYNDLINIGALEKLRNFIFR